jgi:EAL domain-containing protein (putative c-di-GMP-specific phosphodiesterase class I)
MTELPRKAAARTARLAALPLGYAGRNRVVVYHPADIDIAHRRSQMTLVSRITRALEDGRFDLHFQRIRPLCEDGIDEHFELLMRMRTEGDGGLMPDIFIPAAERYNLMPALDRWAIRRTFAGLGPLFAAEPERAMLVAINLSGTTLGSERFTEFVRDQFRESGVPPRAVCFEITETAAIANLHKARAFIDAMHALGCRIALDDFGSGLSSFAYLKALPVDYLKIDGAFIRDLRSDPVDQAMVAAIVKVGEAMGIRTIAEFVDTPDVLDLLRRMGVDYVQGYAIHKPERWSPQRSTRSSTRLCTSPGL